MNDKETDEVDKRWDSIMGTQLLILSRWQHGLVDLGTKATGSGISNS
jgi:hypothetical protein